MNWLNWFADHANKECAENVFFGFPHWGKGLHFQAEKVGDKFDCQIIHFELIQIWTVVANVTRMALALAGLLAVILIIYAGITYITSSGNPDRTKQAQSILTNAVIGLIIAIVASLIVGYIAGLF